jgi:signal transduction histidine kinase
VSDNLRLRRKTALIIVIITVIVFSTISGITDTYLMSRFTELEAQNVTQNVQRATNAVQDDLKSLERTDYDWAAFDDTYQFIQDPQNGQAYIQANLNDPTLINIQVEVIVYFDQAGNVAYSKALDSNNVGTQISQETLEAIEANDELWNHTTLNSKVTGILSVSQGLLMVVSSPILTSEGLGPIMGALVMGRYITDKQVADLSTVLRLPLVIQNISNSHLPTDFRKALSLMSDSTPTCVQPLGADLVGGYATINDLSGNPVLILRIELLRDIYNQGQQDVLYLSLSLGLVCVVFGSAVMLLMEKTVLTPLTGLDMEVKSIRQNPKGSRRLKLKGDDELASLGSSVNEMLSTLEQNQRLATIGELTTAIAHDLRNPMQGINAAAYYLKTKIRSTSDDKTLKMLTLIENDIKYSDRIICQLLDYSQPISLEYHDATPEKLVREAVSLAKIPEKVRIVNEARDDLKITVDKQKIRTVLGHIIDNAVDAMPNGGVLRIGSTSSGENVTFSLSDTGVGISQEVMGKMWNPLFTTKAKGMGLSLPTCRRIVEAHGGAITIQSTQGKGSTFTVTVPKGTKPSPHRTGPPSRPTAEQ